MINRPKNFGNVVHQGITSLFYKLAEGVKKEGPVGSLKEIGMKSIGRVAVYGNVVSTLRCLLRYTFFRATWILKLGRHFVISNVGLLAYPAQGAYFSVRALTRTHVQ